jgi:hypothetical protein
MLVLLALSFAAVSLSVPALLRADVSQCACDPAKAASLEARECSLCREAEHQPPNTTVFFLKDINPRKPNRWLALPRVHLERGHGLRALPKEVRVQLWKSAISKARELWGDEWGLAYNGDVHRTQCHTHVHIGKLLKGLAPGRYIDVDTPEQIPAPDDDTGLWIHPLGNNKLRVHLGEGITETTLLR